MTYRPDHQRGVDHVPNRQVNRIFTNSAGDVVSDGDKGDIVVSGSGASWAFDSGVVTAFARTILDDADAASVRTTIGAAAASHTHAQSDITGLVAALAGKEATIAAGTTAQYWRGDKSWQALDKSAVGLANVDNTSDLSKPVSTATQTALNLKANLAGAAFTGAITAPTLNGIPFSSPSSNSIGIGIGALGSTTGNGNTAIGTSAGDALTTGNQNFAFGTNALTTETTGSENVAIGRSALQNQNGANRNLAIGVFAGLDLTTGGKNTLIGYNTGRGITTGADNTIIGGSVTGLAAGTSNNIILADGAGNIKYRWDGTLTTISESLQVSGQILSSWTGIGYTTGAGGTVTQITSKATSVTLNKACGTIVTHNAALAAGAVVEFAVDNTTIAATDTVVLNLASGAAVRTNYDYKITTVSANRFRIAVKNVSAGALSEALTFNFAVIKGVTA